MSVHERTDIEYQSAGQVTDLARGAGEKWLGRFVRDEDAAVRICPPRPPKERNLTQSSAEFSKRGAEMHWTGSSTLLLRTVQQDINNRSITVASRPKY